VAGGEETVSLIPLHKLGQEKVKVGILNTQNREDTTQYVID